jgi:hypothetical protein
MAPRLIARSIAFPVRWGAPAPATATETDRDLTRHRTPLEHLFEALCHSSRVKAQPATRAEPDEESGSFCDREALAPAGV